MKARGESRLMVCYISGMDMRRLESQVTPFISRLMRTCPSTIFANLPSNELFPTLVTGTPPNVHGVWGVQYVPDPPVTILDRWIDLLPDFVTTSFQCLRHLQDNTYDLPAVPPHRRRHFRFTRTKYKRRNKRPEALLNIGGTPTVMNLVGEGRAHYHFSSSANPVADVLPKVCQDDSIIEILELYSLDRHQQWNLDQPLETERFYGVVDDFIRQLHAKCRQNNRVLMLVSDHGHELISGHIDLCAKLQNFGLTATDLSYFIEVSSARFWFHTSQAREQVTRWLSQMPQGQLIRYDKMANYNIELSDDSYGEFFFYLDPGHIFFPHDFYHLLANLFLGLTDPMQRSRLRSPRHRGNHGHLPHVDAEKSFMLVADPNFQVDMVAADILHVAPSILSVIGVDRPAAMSRNGLFRRRS